MCHAKAAQANGIALYQALPSAFLRSYSILYGFSPLSNQHKGATIRNSARRRSRLPFLDMCVWSMVCDCSRPAK